MKRFVQWRIKAPQLGVQCTALQHYSQQLLHLTNETQEVAQWQHPVALQKLTLHITKDDEAKAPQLKCHM